MLAAVAVMRRRNPVDPTGAGGDRQHRPALSGLRAASVGSRPSSRGRDDAGGQPGDRVARFPLADRLTSCSASRLASPTMPTSRASRSVGRRHRDAADARTGVARLSSSTAADPNLELGHMCIARTTRSRTCSAAGAAEHRLEAWLKRVPPFSHLRATVLLRLLYVGVATPTTQGNHAAGECRPRANDAGLTGGVACGGVPRPSVPRL